MPRLKIKYQVPRKQKECPCLFFRLVIYMRDGQRYSGIKTAPDRGTFEEAVQKWLCSGEQYPNVSGWNFSLLK